MSSLGLVAREWCTRVLVCAVALCVSATSRAESSGNHGEPSPSRARDLRLNFGFGSYWGRVPSSGLSGSVLTTLRYKLVEGGLLLDGGVELMNGTYGLIAGVWGPVYLSPRGFRLELLGVLGRDAYHTHVCWLCEGGRISSQHLWAGTRLGASYVFGRHRHQHLGHFELGGAFLLGSDTNRKTVRYEYIDSAKNSVEWHTVTGSMTLGGFRTSVVVFVGGAWDLGS